MKVVILCGGYATRLYPLTSNKSKSLLPVGNKVILDHIIDKIPKNLEIIVVTNQKFYSDFSEWSKKYNRKISVLNDGASSNENRLGGLGDLYFAVEKGIDEDLMIILGDNLFDFDMNEVIKSFERNKRTIIGVYDVKSLEEAKKFGVVRVDSLGKIKSIEEKPSLPDSTWCIAGIYLLKQEDLKKLHDYMDSDLSKEGPTYFIQHLLKSQEVYGFLFDGKWLDVGSIESYEDAKKNWN